ncbi:MAG: hypothetical protein ABFC90_07350 [Bacteroidales bacterium]|nr:hypothetical protein [Bacteroidales bacterium]
MNIKTVTGIPLYRPEFAPMGEDGEKPRNRTSFLVTQARFRQAKKIIDGLKMDWEFDLNKMNFGELRDSNFDWIKMYNPKIGARKIDIWYDGNEGDPKDIFHQQNIDIILDLIEFVQTGKKVIPPIAVIPIHIIDGKRISFEVVLLDGLHRIRLARYLGETEVPMVLYEYTRKYAFTKAKWKIKRIANEYKVSSLNGFTKYTFKMSEWKLSTNEIGDFFLDR